MKRILISVILIILLFTLAGCGYGEYKGNVVDKRYVPAKTVIMTGYNGKMFYSYPIHHNEKYQIKIQKEEDGEVKDTWITLSKEQYENILIGDYWEE